MDNFYDLSHLPESKRIALQDRVHAAWEQRLARYPAAALLWLALTPFWTVKLAETCSFPTGGPEVSVRDLFTRLYDEGFCEFTPASPQRVVDPGTDQVRRFTDKGDDKFRLVDTLRTEIMQRTISKEAGDLDEALTQIGLAILRVQER